MKILLRIFYLLALMLSITILGGFCTGLFGQGPPPPLPNNPYQVPWGNFIVISGGCLGYGVYKIIRKKKKFD